jgi:hypothetical protein
MPHKNTHVHPAHNLETYWHLQATTEHWARASPLKNDLSACNLIMGPAPIIGLEHSGLSAKYAILDNWPQASRQLTRNSVREHINIQQNKKENSKIKQEKKRSATSLIENLMLLSYNNTVQYG